MEAVAQEMCDDRKVLRPVFARGGEQLREASICENCKNCGILGSNTPLRACDYALDPVAYVEDGEYIRTWENWEDHLCDEAVFIVSSVVWCCTVLLGPVGFYKVL